MEAEKTGFFKESQQLIEEYIRERMLLLKFQVAERASGIMSTLFIGIIIGSLSFLILFFLTALGLYCLADLLGSWYLGFGVIILLYAIVLAIIIIRRKPIMKAMRDRIVSLFFAENPETPEEDVIQ